MNSIVAGGRDGAQLHLPVLPGSDLCGALGARPCPARAPARCLARRSPIGPRNIGRIRLGLTRRGLSRIRVKPVRRTRRSYVYCVKGSRGRVTAVFAHAGARARVRLVTTTAAGHRMRRVGRGVSVRRLARRFPGRRRLSRSLVRARPASRRLFGVRGRRVRFVAVAERRLMRSRGTLRACLRSAGL